MAEEGGGEGGEGDGLGSERGKGGEGEEGSGEGGPHCLAGKELVAPLQLLAIS